MLLGIIFLNTEINKPKRNFINQNKGKITYNILMGQSKFSYEMTFWFITVEKRWQAKKEKYLEGRNQSIL